MEDDNNGWLPIVKGKNYKLKDDKIYFKCRRKNNKRSNSYSFECSFYFGKKICDLIDITNQDRVDLFFLQSNPYLLLIRKSKNTHGYTLKGDSSKSSLRTSFMCPNELRFIPQSATTVEYNVVKGDSLMFDLSKFKE